MMAFINTMAFWWGCWMLGQQLGLLYVLMVKYNERPEPVVTAAFMTQCMLLPTLFGA